MNRRQFILGFGGAVASSSVIVGSGAFTSVEADRSVTIDVAPDADAFLRLRGLGEGGRSSVPGDTLRLDIPGAFEDEHNDQNPEGVGRDSVYRFDRDAGADEPGLFEIVNQGTQPIEVYGTSKNESDEPSVALFDTDSRKLLTENDPSAKIDTGDKLLPGIEVDTDDVDLGTHKITLTIHAVAPSN